jgi:hypothetical protein
MKPNSGGEMFRRLSRTVAAIASVAVLGLFAIPEVARAATIDITVTDADGVAVPNAFVAMVKSDGDAIDGSITDATGKIAGVTTDGATSFLVTAPGFKPKTVTTLAAGTIQLERNTNTKLSTANAYGAQVTSLAPDGGSGIAYATTPEAKPSLWRTTDYGGTWSAAPTTADSADGIPQEQVSQVFTSGVEGEVAAVVGQKLMYSRDYGTTWKEVASYTIPGAPDIRKHTWVHAGESSYLFVQSGASLYAAVMPQAATGTAALSNVSTAFSLANDDKVAFVAAKTGNGIFMVKANASATKVYSLTASATSAAGVAPTELGTQPSSTLKYATAGSGDMLMINTLGTNEVKAIVLYDIESNAGNIRAAFNNGSSWASTADVQGISNNAQFQASNWGDRAGGISQGDAAGVIDCGENGTNPVGSIAPASPSGVLSDFEIVGTIRSCMFAVNAAGDGEFGASGVNVSAGKSGVLRMNGANNNTGFIWDSGVNFSDNIVTMSGDGQFGIRKSATISTDTRFRPDFGSAGDTTASVYINSQATAGKEVASGGIAMTGISAASVTDMAYAPGSTDGSRYVVSMTPTGGSRTLLTTDGGTSFSTLAAGGSKAVDWWNAADGQQMIAAGFTNDARTRFLHVKAFSETDGVGATQMKEELAATAAERDAKTGGKPFTFAGAANPSGTCLGLHSFVKVGSITCTSNENPAQQNGGELLAIEGVTGYNAMIVAVNELNGNSGPNSQFTAGTVGVVQLTPKSATGDADVANVKYFGARISSTSGTSADATSSFGLSGGEKTTYSKPIRSVAYCPKGSNAKVADTAFIAVDEQGVYKLSTVSSGAVHGQTATTSGTFKDLKIDCDTGLMVGAQDNGVYFSFDGDKFVKMNLPSSANIQNATAVAVQADKTTGEIAVVVGTNNGDVVALDTDAKTLGSTSEAIAAGTPANPSSPPTLPADDVVIVNSSTAGKATGTVSDVELPNTATDKVTASAVRKFAAASKMAVGTGSGAFKGTIAGGSATGGAPAAGAPAAGTPAAGTPTTGTPTAVAPKVATVGVKKTATVLSSLKTLGITVVKRSKIAATSSTKKVCTVLSGTKVKGLKAGICKLTVKITPPKTKKVPKPKTTTKRIKITIK